MEPTNRSAIALACGARTGVLMIRTSIAVKTASKTVVNLASRSPDEEPEALTGIVEIDEQVAGLLGQPGSGRVGGDAEDVYAAGGVLDDEERVEPVQGDRVRVEQVAGQDALGLRLQELRPGRSGPAWCGVDPGAMEDLPDGGGTDPVTESGEFAMDASIAPGRVLGSQAYDQGTHICGDGRSAGPGVLAGPAVGDELAVPAQDRGWGDQQALAAVCW